MPGIPEMTPTSWFAQGLGLLAFMISLIGYLSPSDRRLKVMMTIGTALLALQFVLLGAWLVAASLVINTGRTWLSIHRHGLRWFIPVAIVQLLAGIALAHRLHDVLPIAGSIIGSFGLLCLRGIPLRYAMLATTTLWFFNNLIWFSIGALLLDGLNASAHIRAIHMLRSKPRTETTT